MENLNATQILGIFLFIPLAIFVLPISLNAWATIIVNIIEPWKAKREKNKINKMMVRAENGKS